MATLGFGRYNDIMGENQTAENNALLENQNNLLNYEQNQREDKLIEEGQNQKIGAQDAGAATSAVSNFARFAVRKAQSGKTFAQLAAEDLGLKSTPSAAAETFNTIQTSAGDVAKTATSQATKSLSSAAQSVVVPAVTEGAASAKTAVSGVISGAVSDAKGALSDATQAVSDIKGAVGGLVSGAEGAADAAEATAKAVASKAAFWGGKALGNVGGAIDLVKDIQSAATGGNFFAGSGKSLTDEIGNGLSLAGSVLDVAGIGLPFLEPLGAALTIAGGITETAGGLSDQTKMEQNTTGDFNRQEVNTPVPQGAAGLGFVASAPTNAMKMITGSSSF